MIDWYRPIFTEDGHHVEPKPPWYPNPVSMQYCGTIYKDGRHYEYWWDDDGEPLDGSPRISNTDPTASDWQPLGPELKNGQPVLLKFRSDIYPDLLPERPDLETWNGRVAVMHHNGVPQGEKDIMGWQFAAPVGCGGFPDEWFVGWHSIPD